MSLPILMPGTGSECFLHYRQPPQLNDGIPLPACYVICPRSQTAQFMPSNHLGFIAIRFKNGRLRHFTDCPFIELQDQLQPLNVLWGSAVEQLYEQLILASSRHRQVELLDNFFLSRLAYHHDSSDLVLDKVMDNIYYDPNQPIADLVDHIGLSSRQFERNFKNAYALTPKKFARLARMQHTLRQISLNPQQGLLTIALERGFSDQSHFIHEVQSLIGIRPSELQKLLRNKPHYYNPPSRQPD
jgi:AraC-like DNA-binding protein